LSRWQQQLPGERCLWCGRVGLAGTGGRGTVIGGSVEQSNVNIATEFAKLIVAQQAYSANAKSITTFNQVSQATIAMLQ
jgi:flagellar hook protein FlgE